ncbi:MAG: glucosamine-6-phosphate deaminase [Planctomycetes bacterium]|nr:glucosamine-6-phosphate deaminase [Planctomycetota bacterium]
MKSDSKIVLTPVEEVAVAASSFDVLYPPAEKIPTIVVDNFPSLGKLAAMRFVEWVQHNPGGVISLPTGKTPEHFIRWVQRLLAEWETPEIQQTLREAGVDPSKKPEMGGLHFVQIDEFYPIDSSQHNSFTHYVKHFYIEGFGLDPAKALLIDPCTIGLGPGETLATIWPDNRVDLTLRYRQATNHLESRQKALLSRIDQWCMEYEQRIRDLGGIGFFLGGIGPDGHIGFNIRGSDHYSTTRLCPTNYETQAAAATDLGGIEIARQSLVITIGLDTIAYNRDCTAIIIAAGQAKAALAAQAIQSDKTIETPASCLQKLPNARFYITGGAAAHLMERQVRVLERATAIGDSDVEKVLVDLAVRCRKRLLDLTEADCRSDRPASVVLKRRREPLSTLAAMVHERLAGKIEVGLRVYRDKCFLHTEPHHDDVMLGYFAQIVRHFRQASNEHHFMTLTSGFTSVTNQFMRGQMAGLRRFLGTPAFKTLWDQNYFSRGNEIDRNRDVWQYLDGVAAHDEDDKAEGCARRMLRNLVELMDLDSLQSVDRCVAELQEYFTSAHPGKKDPERIQRLKGMCREWEAECVWGYYGWQCQNVRHLRLGFYTGDIFTKEPTLTRDVPPIVAELDRLDPDVITVAFDPEASGPDTHYKVMQALAEAIRIHLRTSSKVDMKIWGYRNVWFRFDPSEANLFVPVSLAMFSVMHNAFMDSFITQKDASFPSYEFDGPFSQLAQRIQVEQYQKIKTCLGREWFYNHPKAVIRATRGLVFLREMSAAEFLSSCRELRKSVEDR